MKNLRDFIKNKQSFDIGLECKIKKISIFIDDITANICFDIGQENDSLSILFIDVKDVKITDIDSFLLKSTVTVVKDIKKDQLSGLNWYIQDIENDYISFYSKDIKISEE